MALCAVATRGLSQTQAAQTGSGTVMVIIDALNIPDAERGAIVRSLALMRPVSSWDSIVVGPGQRVIDLVRGKYLFNNSQPRTLDALLSLVADSNGVAPMQTLDSGRVLRFPVLPVRPISQGPDARYVQFLEDTSRAVGITRANNAVSDTVELTTTKQVREAPAWVIKMKSEAADSFVARLPKSVLDRVLGRELYLGPLTEVMKVQARPPEREPERRITGDATLSQRDQLARASVQQADAFDRLRVHTAQRALERQRALAAQASGEGAELLRGGSGRRGGARTMGAEPLGAARAAEAPTPAATAALTLPDPTPRAKWVADQLSGVGANPGRYYLLDFFRTRAEVPCPHGRMVMEVAQQTLESLGAPEFVPRLVSVELDFAADPVKSRTVLNSYIAGFSSNVRVTLDALASSLFETLDDQRFKNEREATWVAGKPEYFVPGLWVQALLKRVYTDTEALVVSTSFFSYFDGSSWVTPELTKDSPVTLLAAVLNDPGSIEQYPRIEPMQTFYERRRDYGFVLVGGRDSTGNPYGMVSDSGDGVTVLGEASGWGTTGTCIQPTVSGNSFATPSIGAMLLVAKAYWNAKQHKATPAPVARDRLLLAADVSSRFVGKYASAGPPRIEKLLRLGPIAETALGDVAPLQNVSGYIEYPDAQTGKVARRYWQPGVDGFTGLYVLDNKTYVFREVTLMWQRIDVSSLQLEITKADGTKDTINTTAQFSQTFKGIAQ